MVAVRVRAQHRLHKQKPAGAKGLAAASRTCVGTLKPRASVAAGHPADLPPARGRGSPWNQLLARPRARLRGLNLAGAWHRAQVLR